MLEYLLMGAASLLDPAMLLAVVAGVVGGGVGKTWGSLSMLVVSQQRNCHGCPDHRRDDI